MQAGSVILHSRDDDVVPFTHSDELVRKDGGPGGRGKPGDVKWDEAEPTYSVEAAKRGG